MDSFGIGSAPDAADFGGEGFTDEGSNTLGHIAEAFALAGSPLSLPNLARLGLLHAYRDKSGNPPPGTFLPEFPEGSYGRAREISSGKDTPSGHWEIAGVPVLFDWSYFPRGENCFPADLLTRITQRSDVCGFLGNCHASGTEIITRLGEEHLSTGYPIFYTSADSVFQTNPLAPKHLRVMGDAADRQAFPPASSTTGPATSDHAADVEDVQPVVPAGPVFHLNPIASKHLRVMGAAAGLDAGASPTARASGAQPPPRTSAAGGWGNPLRRSTSGSSRSVGAADSASGSSAAALSMNASSASGLKQRMRHSSRGGRRSRGGGRKK